MDLDKQNELAMEILEELFLEERLLGDFQKALEAKEKAEDALHEHFYPNLRNLIDEAVKDEENRAEIFKMIKKDLDQLSDTLIPAYVFSYMDSKDMRDEYKKAIGIT